MLSHSGSFATDTLGMASLHFDTFDKKEYRIRRRRIEGMNRFAQAFKR
jgi:hypothetical protein